MTFKNTSFSVKDAVSFMSEKIGRAKGTELDEEFIEMERKIDVMGRLVDDLINKTQEFLQPNPASRAKLSAVGMAQKIRGQGKNSLYQQPEGTLGEHMQKHGTDLGNDSPFGSSLVEAGEAFMHLAEVKYSLEENVKQNFLEPLSHLSNKDLKEVNHHRKKLSGRRLDFDCKKRKKEKEHFIKGPLIKLTVHQAEGSHGAGSTITDEDLKISEEKFEESKNLAETAMCNVLENDNVMHEALESMEYIGASINGNIVNSLCSADDIDLISRQLGDLQHVLNKVEEVEQIAQLEAFINAQTEYHRQALDILKDLNDTLESKHNEAASRPKSENVPKQVVSFKRSPSPYEGSETNSCNLSNPTALYSNKMQASGNPTRPCAEALYDFEPENEGELGFQEGNIITLISQIDQNWFEGSLNGKTGVFPVNYVKVVVPFP